jgi:tagaturonate reductase
MENLSKELLKSGFKFPADVKVSEYKELPEKVLQFGEGNFLRAFVDWMFNKMNQQNLFNGRVVLVQPIANGMVDMLNKQDNVYTLLLRGIQNGAVVEEKEVITSVSRGINPYSDFQEYMKCAENPELRVIVSNTTEAGISYNPDDRLEDAPPASYPGKLTVLLYKRFKFFNGDMSKGFIIIPCELIDRNGDVLRKVVLRLANEWNLGSEFINWIEKANFFFNTLVDRIVTGYPKDDVEKMTQELGYKDNGLDTAEIFHFWAIEGDTRFAEEIPFTKAGLDVVWTEDMTPYRSRKVRILNGAHTMTVLGAYLYGKDTVKECMDDELIKSYMNKGIFEEIIPTLDLPDSELQAFAAAVSERFANPFIKHYLLSISLNSTSKFKARVLPSITEYIKRKGQLPKVLTFSLAALIAFYKGTQIDGTSLIGNRPGNTYNINDDMPVLEFFKGLWSEYDDSKAGAEKLVKTVLGNTGMWGEDLNNLPGFAAAVTDYLYSILTDGVGKAMKEVVSLT